MWHHHLVGGLPLQMVILYRSTSSACCSDIYLTRAAAVGAFVVRSTLEVPANTVTDGALLSVAARV